MFCPQCGQQQATGPVRFCSRCGFALDGVAEVMAHGGILPVRYAEAGKNELAPRQKGIRQGVMLMLCTLLVVPVISIITVQLRIAPQFFIPLSAFICFIGGLLRILYAALFETDAPRAAALAPAPSYVPPAELTGARRPSFLPPQQSAPVTDWRGRKNTAELVAPPSSVTENTTRLLDEKKIEPPAQ
ncbi:MAG: hypothetical protein WCB68_09690 [Pyrinomonadaceae bacterium]